MKPCPVCNTKVEDLYTGLCPNQACTWEFEFVSEMTPEVLRRYEEKLRRAKAAFAGMSGGSSREKEEKDRKKPERVERNIKKKENEEKEKIKEEEKRNNEEEKRIIFEKKEAKELRDSFLNCDLKLINEAYWINIPESLRVEKLEKEFNIQYLKINYGYRESRQVRVGCVNNTWWYFDEPFSCGSFSKVGPNDKFKYPTKDEWYELISYFKNYKIKNYLLDFFFYYYNPEVYGQMYSNLPYDRSYWSSEKRMLGKQRNYVSVKKKYYSNDSEKFDIIVEINNWCTLIEVATFDMDSRIHHYSRLICKENLIK